MPQKGDFAGVFRRETNKQVLTESIMAFKDLQTSINKLSSDLQGQIARVKSIFLGVIKYSSPIS
jgi:hypothetical protein